MFETSSNHRQESTSGLRGEDSQLSMGKSSELELNYPKIIEVLFVMLLFLLPIFFLPFTIDALMLNKTFLVLVVSAVSLLLYYLHALQKQYLGFLSSYLQLPLVFLVVGGVVSVIFSQNVRTSLYGVHGNYQAALHLLVAFCLLVLVASGTKLNVNKLIHAFILGTGLSTVVALLTFNFVPEAT